MSRKAICGLCGEQIPMKSTRSVYLLGHHLIDKHPELALGHFSIPLNRTTRNIEIAQSKPKTGSMETIFLAKNIKQKSSSTLSKISQNDGADRVRATRSSATRHYPSRGSGYGSGTGTGAGAGTGAGTGARSRAGCGAGSDTCVPGCVGIENKERKVQPQKMMFKTCVESYSSSTQIVKCPKCGYVGLPFIRKQKKKVAKNIIGAFFLLGCWSLCLMPLLTGNNHTVMTFCRNCGYCFECYKENNNLNNKKNAIPLEKKTRWESLKNNFLSSNKTK